MVLWRAMIAAGATLALLGATAEGQGAPTGSHAINPIPDSSVGPRERGKPGPPVLSVNDHVLFTRADDAAIHEDWVSARALAAQGADKTAREMMEFRYALDEHSGASFDQIAAVVTAHPDWPRHDTLLARAEKAMTPGMNPRQVIDWFNNHPPVSGYGQMRLGEAIVATGRRDEGVALIRKGWIEGDFDVSDEGDTLARDREYLGPETQAARLDRLLWTDDIASARRQLERTSGEAHEVGEARLKLKANLAHPDSVVSNLPASLRDDPGLIFEHAHALRRAGRDHEAWAAMVRAPEHVPHPEVWWPERHVMARDALRQHEYQRAYELVEHHDLTGGTDFVDAEFLAGWIALRFLHEPAVAERRFRHLAETVAYPVSRARGYYWLARADEAQGKTGEAVANYRIAAKEPAAFYGQLALARIEEHPVLHIPEASGDVGAARAAMAHDDRVAAMRIAGDLGQKDIVRLFAFQVARDRSDGTSLHALAAMVADLGDRAGSVRIAKQAYYEGTFALPYLHPVIALPRYPLGSGGPESALVHGLIRQETEFDPDSVSGAGARGLIQLMPASARSAANRCGLPYNFADLTADPAYNLQLGMCEFGTYLTDWNGSYVLAIASYNAGEGRAREWVGAYGDPRDPGVDPIDWIELIPFSETRNYVMRVLENVEVYRNRLAGGDRPLMILTDLYRPNAPHQTVLRYSGAVPTVDTASAAPPASSSAPEPAASSSSDDVPPPPSSPPTPRPKPHRVTASR